MAIITKLFNLLKTSHKEEATCVLLDLLISGTISAAACVPDFDMTKALGTEYWRGLTNEEIGSSLNRVGRGFNHKLNILVSAGSAYFLMHA